MLEASPDDIRYLVIIGIAVMFFLFTGFLISFVLTQRKKLKYQQDMQKLREAQQNQLIEAAVRSEETERHRIAETLHDEVGAILSSSKLHLQGVKTNHLDDRDRELQNKGKELLDEGIQKVRGISHNLHSNILKQFGLNEAIRHFISKTFQGSLLNATTELDDNYQTKSPENDISIYRMVQELLNNIIKHGGASHLQVTSGYTPQELMIRISHDGRGLTQHEFEEFRYNKEGLGLKNIQNRVILLRGRIEFVAGPESNTVTIYIPQNP